MRIFGIVALILALPAASQAQKSNPYSDLGVQRPFAKQVAIDRFYKNYVPGAPLELRDYLPSIRSIDYKFEETGECPIPSPTTCSNPKEKPYYKSARSIAINLPDFQSMVAQTLASNEEDGCSSRKFKNTRLVAVTADSIRYEADVSATKRACGDYPWPFSGGWATDIASGTGNVQIQINLVRRTSATYDV